MRGRKDTREERLVRSLKMSEGSDLRLFSWRATNKDSRRKVKREGNEAKTKKRDQRKHQNQES